MRARGHGNKLSQGTGKADLASAPGDVLLDGVAGEVVPPFLRAVTFAMWRALLRLYQSANRFACRFFDSSAGSLWSSDAHVREQNLCSILFCWYSLLQLSQ